MPIISNLFKGVGAGIGAASEAIADRKEKKAAKERGVSPNPAAGEEGEGSGLSVPPVQRRPSSEKKGHLEGEEGDGDDSSSIGSSDLDHDQAEWALAAAAEELSQPPPSYEEAAATTPASAEDVAKGFINEHKLAPT